MLSPTRRVRHAVCNGQHSAFSQTLTQIRGLSEAKVEKLVEAAKKMCPTLGWQTAMSFEQQVTATFKDQQQCQTLSADDVGMWMRMRMRMHLQPTQQTMLMLSGRS